MLFYSPTRRPSALARDDKGPGLTPGPSSFKGPRAGSSRAPFRASLTKWTARLVSCSGPYSSSLPRLLYSALLRGMGGSPIRAVGRRSGCGAAWNRWSTLGRRCLLGWGITELSATVVVGCTIGGLIEAKMPTGVRGWQVLSSAGLRGRNFRPGTGGIYCRRRSWILSLRLGSGPGVCIS